MVRSPSGWPARRGRSSARRWDGGRAQAAVGRSRSWPARRRARRPTLGERWRPSDGLHVAQRPRQDALALSRPTRRMRTGPDAADAVVVDGEAAGPPRVGLVAHHDLVDGRGRVRDTVGRSLIGAVSLVAADRRVRPTHRDPVVDGVAAQLDGAVGRARGWPGGRPWPPAGRSLALSVERCMRWLSNTSRSPGDMSTGTRRSCRGRRSRRSRSWRPGAGRGCGRAPARACEPGRTWRHPLSRVASVTASHSPPRVGPGRTGSRRSPDATAGPRRPGS